MNTHVVMTKKKSPEIHTALCTAANDFFSLVLSFYLGDLLELRLGVRAVLVLVGMILFRQLKVLLLDLRSVAAGPCGGKARHKQKPNRYVL